MKLQQALKLRVGDVVKCPDDRGERSYTGRVAHIQSAEITPQVNIYGVEYIWVTVEHPHGASRHVWPSNRLMRKGY